MLCIWGRNTLSGNGRNKILHVPWSVEILSKPYSLRVAGDIEKLSLYGTAFSVSYTLNKLYFFSFIFLNKYQILNEKFKFHLIEKQCSSSTNLNWPYPASTGQNFRKCKPKTIYASWLWKHQLYTLKMVSIKQKHINRDEWSVQNMEKVLWRTA